MSDPKTIDVEISKEPGPSQAVAIRQDAGAVAPSGLFGTQEPVAIIERATNVATALKGVITKQGLISRISGKEYPKCEAWTLLGTMLGVFPVLCWTKPVEGGWEARVEAKTRDGAVVGAAEAQCLRAERNWSNRDDFALRSMAQTRATAKCLRMPLGFVMTLAGYEPTPAEEMVSDHPHQNPPQSTPAPRPQAAAPRPAQHTPQAPKPAQEPPAHSTAPVAPKPATDAHRAKMIANLKAAEGEPNRRICHEYFEKIGQILPTETLEDLPLRFVPRTPEEMHRLAEMIARFGDGEPAARAFEPSEIEETAPKPSAAPPATTSTGKPKDSLWWRDVIISLPRKGMKRDQYLATPDTIGALYDMRHGQDEESQAARQRLWGMVQWEPKPREYQGKTYQPSAADLKSYKALQAFKVWFEANHPEEKL